MKTIGLIGGMSWESTVTYYQMINTGIKQKLGGLHSAKCVLVSVDFAEIEELQRTNNWVEAGKLMVAAARSVERAGGDCVVLCTNTMHKLADEMQNSIQIPLLHIADATGAQIRAAGLRRVGLLGTRFTMEEDFYKGRLAQRFGLEVLVPPAAERDCVHDVIYNELCLGTIRADSRSRYREIISNLVARGAEGIILGCTEIGLLVKPEDSPVPQYDTTLIHAGASVAFALAG